MDIESRTKITRPKPAEILDRDGVVYGIFFDDVTEEDATEIIVRSLQNGISKKSIVPGLPDFLARDSIWFKGA